MKQLLWFLLFCNLVFLFWELGPREQQRQAQQVAARQDLVGLPELVLVSEIKAPPQLAPKSQPKPAPKVVEKPKPTPKPEPQPVAKVEPEPVPEPAIQPEIVPAPQPAPEVAAKPESDSPTTQQASLACYRYGQFRTEDAARELAGRLAGGAWQGGIHTGLMRIDQGFWVIYPAASTMKASQENLEQIKAKGVADYWLVPTGRYRGVISLGLFNDLDRAQLQQTQLAKMGVTTEITKKVLNLTRHQIELRLREPPKGLFQRSGVPFDPDLLQPLESCDSVADAA